MYDAGFTGTGISLSGDSQDIVFGGNDFYNLDRDCIGLGTSTANLKRIVIENNYFLQWSQESGNNVHGAITFEGLSNRTFDEIVVESNRFRAGDATVPAYGIRQDQDSALLGMTLIDNDFREGATTDISVYDADALVYLGQNQMGNGRVYNQEQTRTESLGFFIGL